MLVGYEETRRDEGSLFVNVTELVCCYASLVLEGCNCRGSLSPRRAFHGKA